MNRHLIEIVDRACSKFGVGLVRRPVPDDVQSLLRDLRPTLCDLVRVGPQGDGGYLVPPDFDGLVALFSPGVDRESRFEAEVAEMGIPVYLADRSVDSPALPHPNFLFDQLHLAAFSRDGYISLDDWCQQRAGASEGDLMLQMDIEGAEFECILSMSPSLQNRFRTIVVEFHFGRNWCNGEFVSFAAEAIRKLLATHVVVHFHPNNCCGVTRVAGKVVPNIFEITLYRKDRMTSARYANQFPHALDVDNTDNAPIIISEQLFEVGP